MSDLDFDYLQGAAYGPDNNGIYPSNLIDPRLDDIFTWPRDGTNDQSSGPLLRSTTGVAGDQSANYRTPSVLHAFSAQHSAHNIPTYPEVASGGGGGGGARKRRRTEPQTPIQVTPHENLRSKQGHTSPPRCLGKSQARYSDGAPEAKETKWFVFKMMYHLTIMYQNIRDEMEAEDFPPRHAAFYMDLAEKTNIDQENNRSGVRPDTPVEDET